MNVGYKRICLLSFFFLLYASSVNFEKRIPVPTTTFAHKSENQKGCGTVSSRTFEILIPQASGTAVLGGDPVTVDISHTDQGYIMAKYTGTSAKANIQITGPDGINYKYFIKPSESYTPLPLTSGNGTYNIAAYENLVDTKYVSLFKETTEVSLTNDLLPYLYPNQYVYFTEDMQAIKTAAEIVNDTENDLEAVADIYHYVIKNITYDDKKAASVKPGYLPDIDSTLKSGTGICFDYASLTAAMLRSLHIPTKLEIGYSGEVYHSWISVYTEETGWIDKIIEFSGDTWTRMDPTFAAGNDNSKKILKYISNDSNYTPQYIR